MNNSNGSNVTEKVKLSVGPDGGVKESKEFVISTPEKLIDPMFKPNKNFVLIDPIPAKETKTKSGLILPEDKEPMGIVVAVGDLAKEEYQVGDIVLLDSPNQTLYFINGHAYISVYGSTIIGKYLNVKVTKDGTYTPIEYAVQG